MPSHLAVPNYGDYGEDGVSAEAVRACSEAKRCVCAPGEDGLSQCKACQSYPFPIFDEVG